MLPRLFNACLVRPGDVAPSHPSLEVVGAFNPGAAAVGNKVVLLVRVAERPRERRDGFTGLPRWDPETGATIDWVANDALRFVDPRVVEVKATGLTRLTFLSHLIALWSADGRTIDSFDGVRFQPQEPYETFGVEDPRITPIGDRFYLTYVAVSPDGAATALASPTDFTTFQRHGIIFPSENKDVVLFPETLGGDYVAFHRPNPATLFAPPAMWLARSADLIHWGRHQVVHGGGESWESGRIGGGTPPLRTAQGWLAIYHGNDKTPDDPGVGTYAAGALLLDLDNPAHVLRRSPEPIMRPVTDFERGGFVSDVVFPTGIVPRDDRLLVYYGAADAHTAVVEFALDELLETMVADA